MGHPFRSCYFFGGQFTQSWWGVAPNSVASRFARAPSVERYKLDNPDDHADCVMDRAAGSGSFGWKLRIYYKLSVFYTSGKYPTVLLGFCSTIDEFRVSQSGDRHFSHLGCDGNDRLAV